MEVTDEENVTIVLFFIWHDHCEYKIFVFW